MSDTAERILATGATVSAILLSLTGGLAIVVRSLKQTDLSLSLSLARATDSDDLEEGPERSERGEFLPPHSQVRARR